LFVSGRASNRETWYDFAGDAMALELQTGGLVGQRYRLVRLIGEGGMGSVWAATHVVTRKSVALKFLKGADASRSDVRRRFLREARAATAVRHPNVVEVHDIFELDDGSPVMVMDLLVGRSLGARLRQEKLLPANEVASILLPVVSAVGTAHAVGIVHRDLKPDNIFLTQLPDGKPDVRVLDFGIAKLTATDGDAALTVGLTQTGDMLGTPHYMAPEQASGESDIDHRADVWALGVILYECLSGVRPVQGNNLGQILKRIITGCIVPLGDIAPQIPKDLETLVATMLAHDRAQRPADLRHVQEVLRRFSDLEVPTFGAARSLAQPVTPTPRLEVTDPFGATGTPTRQELKKAKDDPRWQAATFSLEPDKTPDPQKTPLERPAVVTPPTTPVRARWPLFAGAGVVALLALGVGLEINRAHPVAAIVSDLAAPPDLAEPDLARPPDLALPDLLPRPKRVHHEKHPDPKPTEPLPPAPKPDAPARLPGGVPEKPPY
jgi:serine/threonine-protein kinase